jgi:alpha-N-arabinofuranosidase
MFVPFQDATSVPLSFDPDTYVQGDTRLPRVDAVAARDKDGKLWVAVTNADAVRPVTIQINTDGTHSSAASGQTLAAPRIDSVNTFEAPATVAPKPVVARASGGKISLHVAPASVTVVELTGR